MPLLNTGTQLTGAVTDIVNTALLLPLLFSLYKTLSRESLACRLWLRLMALVCVSCALGALVHLFQWDFTGRILIWFVLYPIIMAACNDFLRLGLYSSSNGLHPSKKLNRGLNIALVITWALLIILFFIRRDEPIRVFMVYTILTVVPGFFFHSRLALRGHKGARLLLSAFLPLLFGAVLMLLQTGHFFFILPFDHNSIMHLFITFAIVIFYLAARTWKKEPLAVG